MIILSLSSSLSLSPVWPRPLSTAPRPPVHRRRSRDPLNRQITTAVATQSSTKSTTITTTWAPPPHSPHLATLPATSTANASTREEARTTASPASPPPPRTWTVLRRKSLRSPSRSVTMLRRSIRRGRLGV